MNPPYIPKYLHTTGFSDIELALIIIVVWVLIVAFCFSFLGGPDE